MPDEPQDDAKNQIRAVPLEDVRRARGEVKIAMPRSKVASLRAFRRVRADRSLGAIGVLLLLVGISLIFTWEKPPEVEKKYGVEWPLSITKVNPIVGTRLAEGSTATHPFPMQVPNATALIFSLVWKDDIGDQAIEGDTLVFDVKGPSGVNVTNATIEGHGDSRTGGNITIPIGLNGIPDIASVNAETNETAFAAVGDRTNRTGIGQWTLTVRVKSAPGDAKNEAFRDRPCPAPGSQVTCIPDGGQAYEIHISYATYNLRLKKLF